ncbi:MAG TPA: nucleotidyltransferase domain-containing protein [Caldilineaceae bacterium]|nr:nucleotidyltransferase domain-containing protein [Caldilineaceae bacterium]
MAKTALDLTPEERQTYRTREAIERRQLADRRQTEARWCRAQQLATQAAKLLREEFGAQRVLLFGSAAHRERFTPWSDVDLAAWGIPPERFYAAVAAVTGLDADIKVDLVDPDHCSPGLQAVLVSDGVVL